MVASSIYCNFRSVSAVADAADALRGVDEMLDSEGLTPTTGAAKQQYNHPRASFSNHYTEPSASHSTGRYSETHQLGGGSFSPSKQRADADLL